MKVIYTAIAALALSLLSCTSPGRPHSDQWFRSRAVRIFNDIGMCSGEQVKTETGNIYLLTAAHCRHLANDKNEVHIMTEDGRMLWRHVIAEDDKADLLLIESVPNMGYVEVAKAAHYHEHVRTYTHGANLDTYRTDGELIQLSSFDIPLMGDTRAECVGAKYKFDQVMTFFGPVDVCLMHVSENLSTAQIVPGSSGGMVVNDKDQLVGVVSASGGGFSAFVTRLSIEMFLANY